MHRFSALLISFAACAIATVSVRAEDGDSKSSAKPEKQAIAEKQPDPKTRRTSLLKATPEREAAARTFARLHHPELLDLLDELKRKRQADYNRAVRDLFVASEKLAKIQERTPERYDHELHAWKLGSRIRLLLARWSMSDGSKSLEDELRDLVLQSLEHNVSKARVERDRLRNRLDTLEESITSFENNPTAAVEAELERQKNRAPRTSAKKRTPKRPQPTATKKTDKKPE